MDRRQPEHLNAIGNEECEYDSVRGRWTRQPGFTEAWLKHGESLSILQRSGFTILSLLFTMFGLFLLWACVIQFRDGSWIFVLIFGGATALFLSWGLSGLRNVLKFPPSE